MIMSPETVVGAGKNLYVLLDAPFFFFDISLVSNLKICFHLFRICLPKGSYVIILERL